jgi:hypothetical protein
MVIKRTDKYIIDCAEHFSWISVYDTKMNLLDRFCYGCYTTKQKALALAEKFIKEIK